MSDLPVRQDHYLIPGEGRDIAITTTTDWPSTPTLTVAGIDYAPATVTGPTAIFTLTPPQVTALQAAGMGIPYTVAVGTGDTKRTQVTGFLLIAAPGQGQDSPGIPATILVGPPGVPGASRTLDSAWGRLRAALAVRNVKPAPIVYCGSSSTAGADASDAAHRWVNLLTTAIQAAYPSNNTIAMRSLAEATAALPLSAGVQGVNAGVSGSASSTYLDTTSCAQIAALAPLVVFHMIGSNDYASGADPATLTVNVSAKIDLINAGCTIVPLHIVVQSYQRGDVAVPAYPWDRYGSALKAVADARQDTVFINAEPFFDEIGVPSPDAYGVLSATLGPHLGDVGHSLMADIIRSAIEIPDVPQTAIASSNPIVVADTFNRADSPAIGAADTGQSWLTHIGAAAIANGQLTVAAAATFTGTVDSTKTNLDLQVDLTWQGQTTGIMFRSDAGIQNRLGVYLASGAMTLYKTIANVTSAIATVAVTTTVGASCQLRAVVAGTTVAGYLNGTLVGTWSIPADAQTATNTNTRVGLRISSAGTVSRTLDNFLAKSI